MNIISSIEHFYNLSKSAIVNNAAQGWFYCLNFEQHFLDNSSEITKLPSRSEDTNVNPSPALELKLDAGRTIDSLNKKETVIEKHNDLKALIQLEDLNLIQDSFGQDVKVDLIEAQKRTFKSDKTNIVIIGAGVTGLYLANVLKNSLGNDVNILVLDNRSNKQHTRKPFTRDWLTQIPSSLVQEYTPTNIKELLQCFGCDGLMGLQINLFEALLMLSCKEIGVKFYFSPNLDYSKLNNNSISFFFNASAGRLSEVECSASNMLPDNLKLQNLVQNFRYAGVEPQSNRFYSTPNDLDLKIKKSGGLYYPYIGNSKLRIHMIKVTGVSEDLLNTVHEYIEPRNTTNQFYIWKGALNHGFNEGLVFIILTGDEFKILSNHIENSLELNSFLENNEELSQSLNGNTNSFLKMVAKLDRSGAIKINQPFSYSPHINLNAGNECFENKPIFPIGDAYFCGHPKVGNGLWTHLGFINDLVQKIVYASKNQAM